jgi:poly-beta-1,6-N-acetyl-D-glucosamine synthase
VNYVLITPARNEEAHIEHAIQAVVGQTRLPLRWVIVSDGSTDGTDEIVQRCARQHPWIELIRTPDRAERHFAGKAAAFEAGFDRVRSLEYDVLASMDADITFGSAYFEFMLKQFERDPALGLAGTPFREEDGRQYDFRFTRLENVSGACQMFRKECYLSIGGYQPLRGGGIDLVAAVTARMNGWKTRTFTDEYCVHHRKMRTARASHNRTLSGFFRCGYHDYTMGVHPVWQLTRALYQIRTKPFLLAGLLIALGYAWAVVTRAHIPVSDEFVRFRRKEQMRWLWEFVTQTVRCREG